MKNKIVVVVLLIIVMSLTSCAPSGQCDLEWQGNDDWSSGVLYWDCQFD